MNIIRAIILFLMTVKVITGLFTPNLAYAVGNYAVSSPDNSNFWKATQTNALPLDDISVDFWLYWENDGNLGTERSIWDSNNSTTDSGAYILRLNTNGSFTMYSNGVGSCSFTTTRTFTLNTWYHIAYSRDASTGTQYLGLNGTVESASCTSGTNGGVNGGIGIGIGYWSPINMPIDEFHVTDTVDFTTNFTPPTEEYSTGLYLYHFNEGTGTTTNDNGTANIDMDMTGTAGWETGYFAAPTPTPTPSPTPTPTPPPIATASGFLNMPDALTQPNKCAIWYDHESTGDYGAAGNAVYYLINNSPSGISHVKITGNYCDPADGSPCGVGINSVVGGVTVSNYNADFPDESDWDTDSFNGQDVVAFHTDYWIERAFCTVGSTIYEAVTPFGKTMTNPNWADIQQGSFGLKKSCVDFSLTIPLSRIGLAEDWVLTIPNYFCIVYNWFIEFWYAIFGIDTSIIGVNIAAWQTTLNSKAPFAYVAAIQNAIPDIASPSGISSLPDTNYSYEIPRYLNGEWTYWPFISGTFSWSDFSPLQDEITQAREAVSILIWVLALTGVFFTILNL